MTFFSIITPTLQRRSLIECCNSIDKQTCGDWEHIVQIDCAGADIDSDLMFEVAQPRRKFACCGVHHGNFGNTCRHIGWERTGGTYAIYLDDDNWLADDNVLERIAENLVGADSPKVGIFPMMRHGRNFFPPEEPKCCFVDTGNLVVMRDIGQWPNRNEYTLDGIFIEELAQKYGFTKFPDVEPIVIMEKSSGGK